MDCREFRETYTDLVDGLLGEADESRFHEHVAACPRCRQFDRAYRIGVSTLRGLPSPRTSRAFASRVLHTVRSDTGGVLPSLASGFAGAALVVALIGFLAVDLRVLEHREPETSALVADTMLALSPSDGGVDLITFRLRDAVYDPPVWDAYAPIQARDADLSPRVRFAVPVVWTGR
jgi:predicted anti-sigma-YlaC factor YlaD